MPDACMETAIFRRESWKPTRRSQDSSPSFAARLLHMQLLSVSDVADHHAAMAAPIRANPIPVTKQMTAPCPPPNPKINEAKAEPTDHPT
jgi:hypothetical protein